MENSGHGDAQPQGRHIGTCIHGLSAQVDSNGSPTTDQTLNNTIATGSIHWKQYHRFIDGFWLSLCWLNSNVDERRPWPITLVTGHGC